MKTDCVSLERRVRKVAEELAIERGHAVTLEEAAQVATERGAFTAEELHEFMLIGFAEYLERELPDIFAVITCNDAANRN